MNIQEENLPNTLSGLLEVAMEDYRVNDMDPSVVIDMSYWMHTSRFDADGLKAGKCYVCLAGGVLRRRMLSKAVGSLPDDAEQQFVDTLMFSELKRNSQLTASDRRWWHKARALNALRMVKVSAALRCLNPDRALYDDSAIRTKLLERLRVRFPGYVPISEQNDDYDVWNHIESVSRCVAKPQYKATSYFWETMMDELIIVLREAGL